MIKEKVYVGTIYPSITRIIRALKLGQTVLLLRRTSGSEAFLIRVVSKNKVALGHYSSGRWLLYHWLTFDELLKAAGAIDGSRGMLSLVSYFDPDEGYEVGNDEELFTIVEWDGKPSLTNIFLG